MGPQGHPLGSPGAPMGSEEVAAAPRDDAVGLLFPRQCAGWAAWGSPGVTWGTLGGHLGATGHPLGSASAPMGSEEDGAAPVDDAVCLLFPRQCAGWAAWGSLGSHEPVYNSFEWIRSTLRLANSLAPRKGDWNRESTMMMTSDVYAFRLDCSHI